MPATAVGDTRYSFTGQFLHAAKLFAMKAQVIEATADTAVSTKILVEHRGYVVAAVMQSVAALEAEVYEVLNHGPGHHLGSNGIDIASRDFLLPLADLIDGQDILTRYELVLHVLKKSPMKRDAQPSQDASLLVRLRNEVVHYKSQWGAELERKKLYKGLQQLGHSKPPFVLSGTNFFPHHCLSASCAQWAAKTAALFLKAFYEQLGIASPLAHCEAELLQDDSAGA